MQTYVFTVAVTGEDVQDKVEELRELLITEPVPDGMSFMVTEAVRVTD